MEKNYDPAGVEAKWYSRWMERGLFHSDAAAGGEPYCIVIPPPNVTGILHMGHALNNTVQDILARWRRMQGRNVVWMPGTDHAGIATQNVVERALRAEKKTREDLGREAFVARVWEWRKQYGGTIINQLKRLGSSCDWDRERFTMDKGLSDAVAEVFVRLYDKGLIYRGNYIINWCPRCHTALSDEESEHLPAKGRLYYIRYPVKGDGGEHVTVATTRPETLLGDVAIAVHPDDPRYASLKDGSVVLPVLGRELRVIRDAFVDPQFGTGAVKVTPAHDPNDFDMGVRHGLTPVNVMNGDGTMNEGAGPYARLDRFECRKRIVKDLDAQGLIEKIEDHQHAVGHCYRCHTAVEPRLSPQWFVRMKPLAGPAIEAVRDGRVRFVPDRWTKVYLDWMENIRDWCISRQIWWGHRIPVFTCRDCGREWAARGTPAKCPTCGKDRIRQDEDVLDTWFSSWLWPFSTFGWPAENEDLKFYYPTNDLVTASEIIFFWVARMIMAGCEFMGDAPFRTVYIHGTVRADDGRKMSKSLGNSIDPIVVIDAFSADALRCSLMMITATGQDVFLSNDKFEIGRNFATKIWNAARFLNMQEGSAPEGAFTDGPPAFRADLLSPDDRYILARLQDCIRTCAEALERFRFNDATLALHDFVWHEFCDWHVEYSKPTLYEGEPERRRTEMAVMHYVLSTSLRLLHPVMPFLTEELWHEMGYGGPDDFIMKARWPEPVDAATMAAWGIDETVVRYVAGKHDLIRAGRALKADFGIPAPKEADYVIRPDSSATAAMLDKDRASVAALLRAGRLELATPGEGDSTMPSSLCALGAVCLSLKGVDIGAEIAKLAGQLDKTRQELERAEAKLGNETFTARAPEHVVARQRELRDDIRERIAKLEKQSAALSRASGRT